MRVRTLALLWHDPQSRNHLRWQAPCREYANTLREDTAAIWVASGSQICCPAIPARALGPVPAFFRRRHVRQAATLDTTARGWILRESHDGEKVLDGRVYGRTSRSGGAREIGARCSPIYASEGIVGPALCGAYCEGSANRPPIACNCRHPQCAYLQHIPLRRTGFSFAALMPEPNAGRYSPPLIWDRRQTADAR